MATHFYFIESKRGGMCKRPLKFVRVCRKGKKNCLRCPKKFKCVTRKNKKGWGFCFRRKGSTLSQISRMDFLMLFNWASPFKLIFRGIRSNFSFFSFFDEIHVSKLYSPRWDAAFCDVTSGAILFAYVP